MIPYVSYVDIALGGGTLPPASSICLGHLGCASLLHIPVTLYLGAPATWPPGLPRCETSARSPAAEASAEGPSVSLEGSTGGQKCLDILDSAFLSGGPASHSFSSEPNTLCGVGWSLAHPFCRSWRSADGGGNEAGGVSDLPFPFPCTFLTGRTVRPTRGGEASVPRTIPYLSDPYEPLAQPKPVSFSPWSPKPPFFAPSCSGHASEILDRGAWFWISAGFVPHPRPTPPQPPSERSPPGMNPTGSSWMRRVDVAGRMRSSWDAGGSGGDRVVSLERQSDRVHQLGGGAPGSEGT